MQSNIAVLNKPAHDAEFAEKRYTICRQMMPRDMMDVAFRYYLQYVATGGYFNFNEKSRSLDSYADALGEAMMPQVQAAIEGRVGHGLLPTYSFARMYTTESVLDRHVDRGACEISATMTIGYRNIESLWPIRVDSNGIDTPLSLDVGDALIYRGMELPHWRDPLPKGIWCQMFFHFVAAGGSMVEHQYDGRGRLGPRRLVDASERLG